MNYKFLPIVLLIVFIALIILGSIVVFNSYDLYNQSKEFSESLSKKNPVYQGTPNYTIIQQGYSQALFYFTLALGVLLLGLLLPRLQNISISPTGGITLSLKDQIQNIEQKVGSLIEQTNQIQAVSVGSGGIKSQMPIREEVQGEVLGQNLKVKDENNDDPQKGKWGGSAQKNERLISAKVKESERPGYYEVNISVVSTDPKKPLSGLVKFHLHPSFRNPDPVIAVKDGKAVLVLKKVYGAFTVGAEVDEGKTQLELDLAELPDAPTEFKAR